MLHHLKVIKQLLCLKYVKDFEGLASGVKLESNDCTWQLLRSLEMDLVVGLSGLVVGLSGLLSDLIRALTEAEVPIIGTVSCSTLIGIHLMKNNVHV